jgi:exosortase/archaeosortase family protein
MQENKLSTGPSVLNHHGLSIALKVSAIIIAVTALYFQDLRIIFSGVLTTESTFHILAIPFIFAFLIYRKRKMVAASLTSIEDSKKGFQKHFSFIIGITLCAVAILTYWYGSYSFIPLEFHMVTLPFLVAGLILVLFNLQTLKHIIFPVAFLIFLTPPPSEILFGVGSTLAVFSAVVSNALTNVFGISATLSSSDIGPIITILRPDGASIPFNVSVACSGIYSLIGFTIFALVIAYITAGKFRNKLVILAIGIPFMILLNIIRITVTLAIGYSYGEALALELFHSTGATILMFIGTLILLGISEKIIKKPPTISCPDCVPTLKNISSQFCDACGKISKYPKAKLTRFDVTKIIGIALITVLLVSIQAPTFALTQGPAEVLSRSPQGMQVRNQNDFVLPDIDGYNLRYAYRDAKYEQTSSNDAALVYVYSPEDKSKLPIWVAVQIGASQTSQHRWETCLINYPLSRGGQASVTQFALRDAQLQENPPMTGRFFAFQYNKSGQTQAVFYWYQTAIFSTNGTSQTKSVMISLIAYLDNADMIDSAENQQIPIAKAINSHWQPLKTWSAVTLIISQNGLALSLSVATVLILLIIYAIYLDKKEKNSLLTLYRKLSTQDQLLIKAINNAGKSPSTKAIVAEFQKLSTISVTEYFVIQKLKEAENNGLITQNIKNSQDNPILVWKLQLPKTPNFFNTTSQF